MRKWLLAAFAACFLIAVAGGVAYAQQNKVTLNQSVVITTGGTFQQILPTQQRWSLTIQNNNAADSCWIFVTSDPTKIPTTANSIMLLAAGSYARFYPFIPSDPVQATCASDGDTLYIDTQ